MDRHRWNKKSIAFVLGLFSPKKYLSRIGVWFSHYSCPLSTDQQMTLLLIRA